MNSGNVIIYIFLLGYTILMIYFYQSEDKKKKKIGKGMLIALGIIFVLPVIAGILLFATCLGVISFGGR